MAPTKSEVWKYYMKHDDGTATATCRFCNKKLKSSGNTTNLMGHIVRVHKSLTATVGINSTQSQLKFVNQSRLGPEFHNKTSSEPIAGPSRETSIASVEINDVQSDDEMNNETVEDRLSMSSISSISSIASSSCPSQSFHQTSIKQMFSNISSLSEGGNKFQKINNAILFMICKDMQPLNIVANEGFQNLMKTIIPQYKIPSRDTFSRLLDSKYESCCVVTKERLNWVESLTLTTDIWTDTMQTRSFLGITVHFTEKNSLSSITLGVVELDERHTANYLAEQLLKTMENWNIGKDKITAVITDSGANIVKAVDIALGKNVHIPCFAHTLNLVADKSIEKVPNLLIVISKIKSIVTWFKQSVVASDELRKHSPKKLIQEVATRWNSKYYMIERFLEVRGAINDIVNRHVSAPSMISALEIKQMEEVISLLSPLEAATKELCGQTYVTASKIIPMTNCLKNKIQSTVCHQDIAEQLKKALLAELQKRFGHIEEVRMLAVATILDPRFKKIHFQNPIACTRAVAFLNNILETNQEEQPDSELNDETFGNYKRRLCKIRCFNVV